MRRYLHTPILKGQSARQAHCDLPEGSFEREMSKEGFFGPAAFFYHRHPPTAWESFEGPLQPHAFDLRAHSETAPCLWDAPVLLSNRHCEMRFWRLDAPMAALNRNADGDQLLFIHQGHADLFCDFGHLAVEAGDYLILPRGTMWRLVPHAPMAILAVEATGSSFTLPDRGLLGPHALFDPAVLDVPDINAEFLAQQHENSTQLFIKRLGQRTVQTYPFNPLDAIGWHGELSVWRLNVRDIRPVMSHRYHLPPSAHTTFMADRFVVCTFAPRPIESDPKALKVPFFHNNDDYDEVIFYHAGDFFSRDNIAPGMMTYHPAGFTHGPHPKALKGMFTPARTMTDEYAVMIDTRDPLEIQAGATAVEVAGYADSWKSKP